MLSTLRTGLDDDEVRITAALVAARLGAGALAGTVRAPRVAAVFAGAHAQPVAALDAGRRLPSPPAPADEAHLLMHALLAPLLVVPPAPALPRHRRRDGGVARLARSGLEVALVPSLPRWLGGAGPP
ncbi:MAG: hypothetical protein AB1730_15275 [Myxococcota bacterium]